MLDSSTVRWLRFLLLASFPAFFAVHAAAAPVDRATFEIRVRGHVVGREAMNVDAAGDSLAITSSTTQLLGPVGADSLIKQLAMSVDSYDLNLRNYASAQRFRGHFVTRGLSLHDTVFTSYRDQDGRGTGDTFARPPGQLFVIDPGTFASFDLVCRMLRGRAFEKRSINLVVLGPSDTVLATPLVDQGSRALKQGKRTVMARHLTLGEEPGAYHLWMGRDGHLLRLEQEPSGLHVERVLSAPRRRVARAT